MQCACGSDLQASTSLELHDVLGSDLDGGTRLWVATFTSLTVANRERTESNERHAVTLLQRTVDGTSSSIESASSVGF